MCGMVMYTARLARRPLTGCCVQNPIHGHGDRHTVATALDDHQLVTSDKKILDWNGNLSCLDARQ